LRPIVSSVTTGGIRATDAGSVKGLTVPLTADRAASKATESTRRKISSATTAWVAALAQLEPTSTIARGSRSATTPPMSRKITFASDRAPTTRPRLVAEPVRSRTAKAKATGAIEPPIRSTVLATTSHRNGAERNGRSARLTGRSCQVRPSTAPPFALRTGTQRRCVPVRRAKEPAEHTVNR
jgi:hypothetical protein